MSAASASRASAAARQGAGPGAAAGPRNAMPASVVRAVRTVDRWGLVAGVTGLLANVLLVVLFTTPADGPYSWLLGAARLPGWYLGVQHWADGLGTAYFSLLAPAAMGCLAVAVLRTRARPGGRATSS